MYTLLCNRTTEANSEFDGVDSYVLRNSSYIAITTTLKLYQIFTLNGKMSIFTKLSMINYNVN